MRTALDPFSFVVASVAEWMNQHQRHVINYLTEENRVLRDYTPGSMKIAGIRKTRKDDIT